MNFNAPETGAKPEEIIKPSVVGEEKPPTPFREKKFWLSQIAENVKIARFHFYEHEKKYEDFRPEKIKAGTAERRIYNWDEFNTLISNYAKRHPVTKKVKTFTNIKGGVGKSTLSSQVCMYANLLGLKVLAIDLDPQAHLTLSLGRVFVDQKKPIITHHWFNNPQIPVENIIQMVTPLLGLIPSNLTLSSLDNLLFLQNGREFFLKEMIDKIRDDWDLIIIDTAPSESILNTNAILASDELCVPCKTDFFSVDGMSHLFGVILKLMTKFKIEPTLRVIPNLYDIRDSIAQESLGALRKYYGKYLSETVVRKNTDITECQKIEQSIWQYNKSSTGHEDIKSLTKELIKGQEHVNETACS